MVLIKAAYAIACGAVLNGISSAMPAPQASSTVAVVTITVVPIPVSESPYPGTPYTNEFQYVNYDETNPTNVADRETVHKAFSAWADVMTKAVESLADSSDDTIKRWFPDTVTQPNGGAAIDARTYVSNVFGRLLNQVYQPPAAQPRVGDLIHEKNDFGNACKSSTNAYMAFKEGIFHVCKPKGLSQVTSAADISCDSLGSAVSQKMQTLTGTFVHEFMHWNQVGEQVPNSVGHITDKQYGTSNCARLAKGSDSQQTFVNADSYKWFALNAYYNSKCNKKFGDPSIFVGLVDTILGMAELGGSPEYNSAGTTGVVD